MNTRSGRARALQAALVAGCAAAVLGGALPAAAAGGADVAATITGPSGTVAPGSTVTYHVTVANRGPGAAPGTIGFIAVDGRSRVDSVTTTKGTCANAKGKIQGFSCAFGILEAGAAPVQVTVRATMARKVDLVTAYVQVASDAPGSDPNGANNAAEFVTTVR